MLLASHVIPHFIYFQIHCTSVKFNKAPVSNKLTFIASDSLIPGPYMLSWKNILQKKEGPMKKTGQTHHSLPVFVPAAPGAMPLCAATDTMITIIFKECNDFSQKMYDSLMDGLQLFQVECTCGKKGCLIRYGHYRRSVKLNSAMVWLSIQRVFCTECGVTHALIPSILVPYSQVPLSDQQQILDRAEKGKDMEPVMQNNLLIDENNVKYIIRQFKRHWKQRLLSAALAVMDDLTAPCLSLYSRQFMQVHRTRNKLCTRTNTA